MLDQVMNYISEQQKLDGEIERSEFNPDFDVSGWPVLSDPEQRGKVEQFVLRKCVSDRHRFKMADGRNAVVYFDARGRAVHSPIGEVSDADLIRMAQAAGKRVGGRKKSDKPSTNKTDHGYVSPVQEGNMDISDQLMGGMTEESNLDEMRYHVQPDEVFTAMKQAVTDLLTARRNVRKTHEYLRRIGQDATGVVWNEGYQDPKIIKVTKLLYDLDSNIGTSVSGIEGLLPKMKKMVKKQ